MTIFVVSMIGLYLASFVAGQVLLKQSMHAMQTHRWTARVVLRPFTIAIAAMTVSFLIKLGLLQRFDLSYLFPFQGLTIIAVVGASAALLHERLTARFWLGTILVSCGVVAISAT